MSEAYLSSSADETGNIAVQGINSYLGSQGSEKQQVLKAVYDRKGIEFANEVDNIYSQFADERYMQQKMGNIYKVSKFIPSVHRHPKDDGEFAKKGYISARDLASITDADRLMEGQTEGNDYGMEKITVQATMQSFGAAIPFSDEEVYYSEDQRELVYRKDLAMRAKQRTEDMIQRDMLGTTTILFGGTANNMGECNKDSVLTFDLIRESVKTLVRNKAKKNTTVVTGSTKVGTQPINSAYYAIIGPEVKKALEMIGREGNSGANEYRYVPAYMYGNQMNLAEGEIGACHEVRFIESASAVFYKNQGATITTPATDNPEGLSTTTTGSGASAVTKFDVFPILFPTKNSFATVGLRGVDRIKFHVQKPSQIDSGNRYGTRGFYSYRMFYAGVILQEEKLLKVLVTAPE